MASAPIQGSDPDPSSDLQGWVSQSTQRGTADIVWSCASTLFICLWAQLHLNIPARHDGLFVRFWRRLRWLVLGAVVPEILLLTAGGQFASAKRSVADMGSLGNQEWTLVHGFYADSGGFVLQAPDAVPFPINAQQLHYLVQNGYIAMPAITRDEIFDKSKGDIFTKTIACLQTVWFLTQMIARFAEHKHVSPLELQTGAIILCTLTTYFLWLLKPLDVKIPTTIIMKETVGNVLYCAGPEALQPYFYTPLDFVEPQAHILSLWPHIFRLCYGSPKGPMNRIPNDRNPRLDTISQRAYFGAIVICFSTSSFIDWFFPFPSGLEQSLWRCACLTAESSLFIHAICEAVGNRKLRKMDMTYSYFEGYKLQWPVGFLLFWIPFGTYVLARLLILVVAVTSLRALPADCYTMISWPHILPYIT